MVDLKDLSYFIVVSDDNLAVSKEVSSLISAGWYLGGDLQIFTTKDPNGGTKIYYAQVMRKDISVG